MRGGSIITAMFYFSCGYWLYYLNFLNAQNGSLKIKQKSLGCELKAQAAQTPAPGEGASGEGIWVLPQHLSEALPGPSWPANSHFVSSLPCHPKCLRNSLLRIQMPRALPQLSVCISIFGELGTRVCRALQLSPMHTKVGEEPPPGGSLLPPLARDLPWEAK